MYIEKIQLRGRTLDEAILRYKVELESKMITVDKFPIKVVDGEKYINIDGVVAPSTEIVEESNYYPFGLKHKGYNNVTNSLGNSIEQKKGFIGKKHQEELGLGWRDITARNYAFNNPIYFMNPDGMMQYGPGDLPKKNPIGKKMISNFRNSNNKSPGGDCFAVCKGRFAKAYKQVIGTSLYGDLPKSSKSTYYNAKKTFNNLFASATGTHVGWKGLPKNLRGKGGAGAIVNASMGEMVNKEGIWRGELQEGAVMQLYATEEDFNNVVEGTDEGAFGHSVIFLNYTYNEDGSISGVDIADQYGLNGYAVTREEFAVWFEANITVGESREEVKPINLPSNGIQSVN